MYILQDELKLNEWQFSQRKYLPYEIKVKLAEARIREWYENWYGEVYLSYSGGVDSTALLYMIRKVLGDTSCIFEHRPGIPRNCTART